MPGLGRGRPKAKTPVPGAGEKKSRMFRVRKKNPADSGPKFDLSESAQIFWVDAFMKRTPRKILEISGARPGAEI